LPLSFGTLEVLQTSNLGFLGMFSIFIPLI
jgi:hypothetical protein